MELKFQKLFTNSKSPTRGSEGAACYDLYVSTIEAKGNGITVYGTGLAIEIPDGYCALVFARSSIRDRGQVFCNSVGVIDSDYRGEITVTTNRVSDMFDYYKMGERCCQLMLMPVVPLTVKEVKSLTETKRGTGGHGSSGK